MRYSVDSIFQRRVLSSGMSAISLKFVPKLAKKFAVSKKSLIFANPNDGAVAQMVEQWTENPCVGSSILPSTTKLSKGPVQSVLEGVFVEDSSNFSSKAKRA